MVAYCAADGCTNQYSPKCNVTYFRFPDPKKQPKLFDEWCKALNTSNFRPKKTTGVCELHFSQDDYTDTYKLKKMFMPGEYFRPMLKPEAIPKLKVMGQETIRDDRKTEILGELLGDSYLKWKMSIPEGKVVKTDLEDSELRIDPSALIIPSILKVIIKEEEAEKFDRSDKGNKMVTYFSCIGDLPRTDFYSCELCSFTTFFKTHLITHQRNVHQPIVIQKVCFQPIKHKLVPVKEHCCQRCNFVTFSKLIFLKHYCQPNTIKSALLNEKKVRNKRLRFLQDLILKEHSYSKQMYLKCEFCFYKAIRKTSLRKHVRDNHRKNDYRFQCDKCSYKCIFENVFIKHLRKHGVLEDEMQKIFLPKI